MSDLFTKKPFATHVDLANKMEWCTSSCDQYNWAIVCSSYMAHDRFVIFPVNAPNNSWSRTLRTIVPYPKAETAVRGFQMNIRETEKERKSHFKNGGKMHFLNDNNRHKWKNFYSG